MQLKTKLKYLMKTLYIDSKNNFISTKLCLFFKKQYIATKSFVSYINKKITLESKI